MLQIDTNIEPDHDEVRQVRGGYEYFIQRFSALITDHYPSLNALFKFVLYTDSVSDKKNGKIVLCRLIINFGAFKERAE